MPPSSRSRGSRATPSVGLQEGRLGRRNKLAKQWNARFEELLNYRSEHGHCDVPQSQGQLGTWVRTQRKAYMANGSLAQGRMDQLDSIGFKWVLKERSTKRGAEPREERNTPSALSLKVPPKRSDDWKESDDEVDEIGTLIYDQAMRQR